ADRPQRPRSRSRRARPTAQCPRRASAARRGWAGARSSPSRRAPRAAPGWRAPAPRVRARSSALLDALAIEAERGVRDRLEPLLRDRLPAAGTGAVRAGVDPRDGDVDLVHELL